MPDFNLNNYDPPHWFVLIAIVLGTTLLMLIIKRFILKRFKSIAEKSKYQLASIFTSSLDLPITFLIFAFNLLLLEKTLTFKEIINVDQSEILTVVTKLLLIVALVFFVDKIFEGLVTKYSDKSQTLKNSKSIAKGLIKVVVMGIGLLIILSTMGIAITPIIASLGITSLAIALALQPTLENFFSGVQLILDKPIRVGDYIELDSGEQGFVEKIGWRSTWVKMLPNNIVIMPNSLLSKTKIINYYYPEKQLSVPVEVGVHYDSDLEHVEKVTLEVAREILVSHKWGISDYETFVIFHTFDDSSINFTVMLRAEEYFNRFFIKSEFMKALHKRYKLEGINIPYPIRALNYTQEKSEN